MMGTMIAKGRPARAGMTGLALALMLGMSAQAGPGPGGQGHGGDGGGMEMLNPRVLKELHLTADQEKKLKDARLAAKKKKIQLHADKATLELDLKSLLGTFPINKPEALKLAEKIAEVEKKIILLKVETMTQALSGLTAEQFAKMQDIQAEWAERRRAWREEMRKDGGDGHGDGKRGKGHESH